MEHGLGATKPHRLAGGDGICSELELGDAGLALGAVLGRSAMLMWGVGLFVAGQASVLATTYAGQAIMDGCLRIQLPATTRVLISPLVLKAQPYTLKSYSFQRLLLTAGTEFYQLAVPILQIA